MPKAFVGTFTIPTAGTLGTFQVTGIVDSDGNPFTPKAIIVWGQADGKFTGNFGVMDEWNNYGFSDGITNVGSGIESRWFAGGPWRGAGTSGSGIGGNGQQYAITQLQAIYSSGYRLMGTIGNFLLGQFSYTLTTNLDGSDGLGTGMNIFNYLAVGGDDLSVKVGYASHITGNNSITGVGFKPTGGMFIQSHGGGTYNDSVGQQLQFGWADASLNTYALCSSLAEGGSGYPKSALLAGTPGSIGITCNNSAGTINDFVHLVSWDTDGFTANFIGGSGDLMYIVFGGPTCYVGTFNETATDTTQTVTIPGSILPTFIMFASVGKPAATTIQNDESVSIGAYDGSRQRAYWQGSQTGATPSGNGGANWGANQALVIGQSNGVPSNYLIERGILTATSFGYGQFNGSWTATDGVARQVIFFTFGATITPTVGSGLYELIFQKNTDTIYTQFTPTVQTNAVPIPMPYADTYLAGGDR